jgi:hypothetical protein
MARRLPRIRARHKEDCREPRPCPQSGFGCARLICLSTPHGRRGFFYEAWTAGGDTWTRIQVPAAEIPPITPEFLAEERREQSDSFRQEYECSFQALEGLVYPNFETCVYSPLSPPGSGAGDVRKPFSGAAPAGTKVGGIDFGYRNPFAAIWGVLDRDDVLWLTGEHYCRQRPLSYHATQIPRDAMWYADPSGAADISELRVADFKVRKGNNAIALGIAAVNARIADARLKILEGACPNLLMEAGLYRCTQIRHGMKKLLDRCIRPIQNITLRFCPWSAEEAKPEGVSGGRQG